jgi:D-glycerate 3-kinase
MSFEASLLERLIDLARQGRRPVIGLNGPVGAGKSTLARRLAQQAAAQGVHLAVASIDDAYLTWEARLEALKGNPFGVDRVPPGSQRAGASGGSDRRLA